MNILRLTEGQQGQIDCAVRGAYPAPTISWSGPTPGPSYGGMDRVNRNVGTQSVMDSQFRGNITVIQEVTHKIRSRSVYRGGGGRLYGLRPRISEICDSRAVSGCSEASKFYECEFVWLYFNSLDELRCYLTQLI